MNSKLPLVSVIIPVFQARDALPGLLKNLGEQSYTELEILIIDDASNDPIKDILETEAQNHNLKLGSITLPRHMGASTARRAGLTKASGEYIQFLSVYDRIHPLKISTQVDKLMAQEDLIMTYTWTSLISKEGELLQETWEHSHEPIETILPYAFTQKHWTPASCLWRKNSIKPEAWKSVQKDGARLFDWICGLQGDKIGLTESEIALCMRINRPLENSELSGEELKEYLKSIKFFKDEWKFFNEPKLNYLKRHIAELFANLTPHFIADKQYTLARECLMHAENMSPSALSKAESFTFHVSGKAPNSALLWKGLAKWYKLEKWLEEA